MIFFIMKQKSFFLVLLVIIGMPILGFSSIVSDVTPIFQLDTVNLAAGDPQFSRLNIYIKITYDELQFIKPSKDKFMAQYETTITVLDKNGKKVDKKSFKDEVFVNTIDETNSTIQFQLKKVSFDMPPGSYQIVVDLEDLETQKTSQIKTPVKLDEYLEDELGVSGILYLDNLMQDENGQYVFEPRISNIKRGYYPVIAYFEIYNVPKDDSFFVKYQLHDEEENIIFKDEYWSKSHGNVTQSFIDINAWELQHGRYVTKIMIERNAQKVNTIGMFNWYIEGLHLSFNNLEQAIETLKYIASDEELETLRNADKDEKYAEFVTFWEQRDPTPQTAENEMRAEYYRRVDYANKNYRSMQKDGWKTDMGWVFVMLGSPDNIEREPFNQDLAIRPGRTVKAIEVWDYHNYSRQFVFFDEHGFGEFKLENPNTLYDILR